MGMVDHTDDTPSVASRQLPQRGSQVGCGGTPPQSLRDSSPRGGAEGAAKGVGFHILFRFVPEGHHFCPRGATSRGGSHTSRGFTCRKAYFTSPKGISQAWKLIRYSRAPILMVAPFSSCCREPGTTRAPLTKVPLVELLSATKSLPLLHWRVQCRPDILGSP